MNKVHQISSHRNPFIGPYDEGSHIRLKCESHGGELIDRMKTET